MVHLELTVPPISFAFRCSVGIRFSPNLLSLSLIANKSRLGGWDWLPRKGGSDCCLEQKCQFPAWVSKTIKSWEPSLQKRKKGFDWVFLNCVFTYGPWLLFFFFFLFIVIGFLPGTVPPRINLLYPSSLAAVFGHVTMFDACTFWHMLLKGRCISCFFFSSQLFTGLL